MPRRTMTSSTSGRTFSFDWDRPNEPTPDDLNGLFAQGKIQFEDKPDEPPSVEPPQLQPSPAIDPPSAPMSSPGDGRPITDKIKSALSIARDTAYGGPQSMLPQVAGITKPALPPVSEAKTDQDRAMAALGLFNGKEAMNWLYNNFVQPSSSLTGIATDYATGKIGGEVMDVLASKFPNVARAAGRFLGSGTPEVLPPGAPAPNLPKALPPSPISASPLESVLGSSKRDFVSSPQGIGTSTIRGGGLPQQAIGDMRPPTRFYQGSRGTADVSQIYPKVEGPSLGPDALPSKTIPSQVSDIPADVAAAHPNMLSVPSPEPGIVPPSGKYQRVKGKFVKKPLPSEYQTGDVLSPTANEYYAGTGGIVPPKTMAEAQAQAVGGIKRSPPISEVATPEVLAPGEITPPAKNVTPEAKPPSKFQQLKESYTEWTKKSATDKAVDILGSVKSIKATADLSFPLRQGIFASSRPEFYKALPEMVKSFASEEAQRAALTAIETHPNFNLAKEAGLAIAGTEESFPSKLPEMAPVIGKVVKGSERAYNIAAKKMRFDIFNSMIETAPPDTLANPKSIHALADWTNIITGRGGLGKLEPLAKGLNATFFSPRFASSRMQLLTSPVRYMMEKDPFVRKQILRDMLGTTTILATMLEGAKMAGATVEDDPRSADFKKIKIGNTRIDLGGATTQYSRFLAQFITGFRKTASGGMQGVNSSPIAPTRRSIADKFFDSKLSPIPGVAADWMRGVDFKGDKFDLPTEVRDLFIPMVSQDLVDIYRDNPNLLPIAGAAAILGAGVQTYKKGPKRRRAYQ